MPRGVARTKVLTTVTGELLARSLTKHLQTVLGDQADFHNRSQHGGHFIISYTVKDSSLDLSTRINDCYTSYIAGFTVGNAV